MSAPAAPHPRTSDDGAPQRPRWRVRLVRARPVDSRRARRVYAGSIALHVLALSALALVPVTRALVGKAGREARIQVALVEPTLALELEEEPEPELEPVEVVDTPELVEQELPPEPLPPEPEEPPLAPLDDRPQLIDPLRDVAFLHFAARRQEVTPPAEAAPPVQPAVVAPPPRPAQHLPAEPQVVDDPQPDYPRAARRMGQEGSVTLRARVARDGSVIEVEIVTSSGHARLDDAAREAFHDWRFRAWRAGEPEPRSFRKTFTFKLP